MIKFQSVRAHQRASSLSSAMILVALLMLPLACATIGKQRSLKKVKAEFEGTWILEEWHIKGQAVSPPKVEGRFIVRDNAFVLILLNRAGEKPWSLYGYGKYTLDASTFSMGFDKVEMFTESPSGITASYKPPWEGMKSFGIGTENDQLHMRPSDGGPEIIVDGNTLLDLQFSGPFVFLKVIRDKYHLGKSVKFYSDNLKTQYLIFTQNCIVAIADGWYLSER